MYRDAISDELRQIERQVIAGERQLAELEAHLVELRKQNQDTAGIEAELERLRRDQRLRELDRQRLLSRLQP